MFGFLGPNGAGKTTTIRTAARPHPTDEWPSPRLRHRVQRRPGRDPPPGRLHPRRVHAVRPPDRRPDAALLRQPARRRGRRLPGVAHRAASTSTRRAGSRSTPRATSRRSGWSSPSSIGRSCSSSTSRHRASTRSIQQSFYELVREATRRGSDGLPVEPHPQRGRADVRPGGDHPRRAAGQGRPGRGAARPRPPPGRAAVHRSGPDRRVRVAPGRQRGRRRRPRPADAGDRARSRRWCAPRPATSSSTSSAASPRSRRRSWPSTAAGRAPRRSRPKEPSHDRPRRCPVRCWPDIGLHLEPDLWLGQRVCQDPPRFPPRVPHRRRPPVRVHAQRRGRIWAGVCDARGAPGPGQPGQQPPAGHAGPVRQRPIRSTSRRWVDRWAGRPDRHSRSRPACGRSSPWAPPSPAKLGGAASSSSPSRRSASVGLRWRSLPPT